MISLETANDTKAQIRQWMDKNAPDEWCGELPINTDQLRQLNAVLQYALRDHLVVIGADESKTSQIKSNKLAALSFLLGREITTTKELHEHEARFLISRWAIEEYKATNAAIREIRHLVAGYLLEHGQEILPFDVDEGRADDAADERRTNRKEWKEAV